MGNKIWEVVLPLKDITYDGKGYEDGKLTILYNKKNVIIYADFNGEIIPSSDVVISNTSNLVKVIYRTEEVLTGYLDQSDYSILIHVTAAALR